MPVISVKHENNKPGYACFHVGGRRDKRWSCRSSSGGEPGSVFDRRRRRDDSPRRRSAATRGPARPQNDDRLRFYCSHAQRSVAVPTTATIMSVVAAVPARRLTQRNAVGVKRRAGPEVVAAISRQLQQLSVPTQLCTSGVACLVAPGGRIHKISYDNLTIILR